MAAWVGERGREAICTGEQSQVSSWAAQAPAQPWAQLEKDKVPGTATHGSLAVPALFGAYGHGWWRWALGRAQQERTFLHVTWRRPSKPWAGFYSA